MHDADDFVAFLLSMVALAIVAAMVLLAGTKMNLNSKCLALGYRSVAIDWRLNRYCVTRTDQTDIVVPIAEADRHKVK